MSVGVILNSTHTWITGVFGSGIDDPGAQRDAVRAAALRQLQAEHSHLGRHMVARIRRSRRSRTERGYVAVLSALFVGFLMMPLCALSVDVARWYVEVQRIQNAADAAATAGVTFLPDDFAAAQSRRSRWRPATASPTAAAPASRWRSGTNPPSSRSRSTAPFRTRSGRRSAWTCRPSSGRRRPTTTGRHPWAAPATPSATSLGNRHRRPWTGRQRHLRTSWWCGLHEQPSVLGSDRRPGHPQGQRRPIHDPHLQRGNDGCTGTTNDEFDPRGHFYVVRVNAAAVGTR